MFLTPIFLIPAAILAFFEIALLVKFYYGLKGKIPEPVDSPPTFVWHREYDHKVLRILFPLAIIVALVVDVSALRAYVNHARDEQVAAELTEKLKPILAKAVSIKRDAICTRNGYIANDRTIESDKIACAQVGDFRVVNPSLDRNSVVVFKARSESEVVQVIRVGYEAITLIDGETTVDQLKAVFSTK